MRQIQDRYPLTAAPSPELVQMEIQTKQLRRIADALEAMLAFQQAEAESFDTDDTPPSVDLAGRPMGAR